MKNLKYLLLIFLVTAYSCNSKTEKAANEPIHSSLSQSTMDLADSIKPVVNNPNKDEILTALEKAIAFCKTADREQFRKYLDVSEERINTVSDKEFIEIKEDNAYLYRNLMSSLSNGEASFKVLSNENSLFEISFTEKGSDSFAVVLNFSYNKDKVLMLDRLNTL